jgi:hypothetical protein
VFWPLGLRVRAGPPQIAPIVTGKSSMLGPATLSAETTTGNQPDSIALVVHERRKPSAHAANGGVLPGDRVELAWVCAHVGSRALPPSRA